MNYEKRIRTLREKMKKEHIKALLISTADNIFYFSGWKFSPVERDGWILVTEKTISLATDSRFLSLYPIPQSFTFCLITAEKRMSHHLKEILESEHIDTVTFESENISYFEYESLSKLPFTFIPHHYIALEIRNIKDKDEYTLIKKACELTDQCLQEILPTITIGMTEKEIARKIEYWAKDHDLELAFPTIVAIDSHAAIAHYEAGEEKVKKGSIILIDCGLKYQQYNADITRMISIGNPSKEFLDTYTKLLDIQQKTINLLADSELYNEVDIFCQNHMKEKNLPVYRHALGHGIGLAVHELPRVSYLSKDTIEEGHVVTIEPGIYIENKYGIRIEDTIYIGKNHKPEILTTFRKQLVIL